MFLVSTPTLLVSRDLLLRGDVSATIVQLDTLCKLCTLDTEHIHIKPFSVCIFWMCLDGLKQSCCDELAEVIIMVSGTYVTYMYFC